MKNKYRVRMVFMVLFLALMKSAGRIIVVDCDGGSDHPDCGWEAAPCGTIQHALAKAEDGDGVELLANVVCSGSKNKELRFPPTPLSIELRGRLGHDGAPSATIDCGGSGRAFIFDDQQGPEAAVRHLVIRACSADRGAAVLCGPGAAPTLDRVRFVGNTASLAGGAVFWAGPGAPAVVECEFDGNAAAYGPDLASDTVQLRLAGAGAGAGAAEYAECASGEPLDPPPTVLLLDYYGRRAEPPSRPPSSLPPSHPATLPPSTSLLPVLRTLLSPSLPLSKSRAPLSSRLPLLRGGATRPRPPPDTSLPVVPPGR